MRPAVRRPPARRRRSPMPASPTTRSSWSASTPAAARLEAIKSGAEDATVAQFPAKMGELGIDTVVKAIRGEKVEANVDTGAGLVTADNVKDFE